MSHVRTNPTPLASALPETHTHTRTHTRRGQEPVGWPRLCCHGDGGWRTQGPSSLDFLGSAKGRKEGFFSSSPTASVFCFLSHFHSVHPPACAVLSGPLIGRRPLWMRGRLAWQPTEKWGKTILIIPKQVQMLIILFIEPLL